MRACVHMLQLAIQTQQRRVQQYQEASGSAAPPLRRGSEGKPERSTARKFKTSMQQRGAGACPAEGMHVLLRHCSS